MSGYAHVGNGVICGDLIACQPLPVYPDKQTLSVSVGTSQMCQRTCMGRLVSRLFVMGYLLVRPGCDISPSRPVFREAAARNGGQGWPKAIAERLALDGREHSGRLARSGASFPVQFSN